MKKISTNHDLHVFVCHGSKCSKNNASQIRASIRKGFKASDLNVKVSRTTCQGKCKYACVVFTEGKKTQYWGKVNLNDTNKLITKLSK